MQLFKNFSNFKHLLDVDIFKKMALKILWKIERFLIKTCACDNFESNSFPWNSDSTVVKSLKRTNSGIFLLTKSWISSCRKHKTFYRTIISIFKTKKATGFLQNCIRSLSTNKLTPRSVSTSACRNPKNDGGVRPRIFSGNPKCLALRERASRRPDVATPTYCNTG